MVQNLKMKVQIYVCRTVKNIGGEKLWQIWQITAFHQVLSPIFTISLCKWTLIRHSFFYQTSYSPYSPKFFAAKVFYCMVTILIITHLEARTNRYGFP